MNKKLRKINDLSEVKAADIADIRLAIQIQKGFENLHKKIKEVANLLTDNIENLEKRMKK